MVKALTGRLTASVVFMTWCFASAAMAAPSVGSLFNPLKFTPDGVLYATNGSISVNTGDGSNTPPSLVAGSVTNTGVFATNVSGKVVMALFCYSDVSISSGVTCVVTGNLGLVLASRGNMTIGTTLNLSGTIGYGGPGAEGGSRQSAAGTGGFPSSCPPGDLAGNGGATNANSLSYGVGYGAGLWGLTAGDGAGYGGDGGSCQLAGGASGFAYGTNLLTDLYGGSGGGGAAGGGSGYYGTGGGGGGAVELIAIRTLTLSGTVNIAGGNARADWRAGGGGSGGGVILAAKTVSITGTINANGGAGATATLGSGNNGGGGGGGRVAFYSGNVFGSTPSGVSYNGGTAGGTNAAPGNPGTFRYNGDGLGGDLGFPYKISGTTVTLR